MSLVVEKHLIACISIPRSCILFNFEMIMSNIDKNVVFIVAQLSTPTAAK